MSFKLTGKRVFKMAPIHHHYEQKGWTEPQIVIRFWIVAVVQALAGLSVVEVEIMRCDPDHHLRRQESRAVRPRRLRHRYRRALMAGGAEVIALDDDAAEGPSKPRRAGLDTQNLSELDWSTIVRADPGARRAADRIRRRTGACSARHMEGVEVIGDIELFCRERAALGPECPLIAITGTNGKSTTTALIAHLINAAGGDAQMGGNIGVAALGLEPFAPGRAYVLEVSSYQIDLAPSLRATVGILLNVSPRSSRPSRQHWRTTLRSRPCWWRRSSPAAPR